MTKKRYSNIYSKFHRQAESIQPILCFVVKYKKLNDNKTK